MTPDQYRRVGETSITEEQRADIIEAAHFRFRRYSVGIHGQVITEWDSIESHVVMETLRWVDASGPDAVARLVEAANQARLAFAGYVSAQSAIDKLDAALEAMET